MQIEIIPQDNVIEISEANFSDDPASLQFSAGLLFFRKT